MRPVLLIACAALLPAAALARPAAPANGQHSYTNAEVYGLTLEDRIDCNAISPVAEQVRLTVQSLDNITFDEAVDMFVYLEGHEGVCGQLAMHSATLVSLAQADPTAFMAQLGLANTAGSRAPDPLGASGGNATGPAQSGFDILKNGSPPPDSSSVKTSSDYSF